jgi:nitroreductase
MLMRSELDEILYQRSSIRAYTDEQVERGTVENICRTARLAPSGANLQPGKFHVLTGTALDDLKKHLAEADKAGISNAPEYSYFPEPMTPELKNRQRGAGFALYESQGISRRDVKRRREQFAQNYQFFGAPVGVVVTIDRNMGKGCFMDLGMAIMTFLLSAEDYKLGASGIGALANFAPNVHAHLQLPDDEMVVCGIALGVPNKAAKINQFRTERQGLDQYASFSGFSEQNPGKVSL